MFEKHLWKSDILSKDAGHRHVKPTTRFLHKWNIGRQWVHFQFRVLLSAVSYIIKERCDTIVERLLTVFVKIPVSPAE